MKKVPLKEYLQYLEQGCPGCRLSALPLVADFHALVVDDISINVRVLARILERLGVASVDVASSASEACCLAVQNPPDVIFADVWMPGMSGEEMCRTFRADARFAQTPIFAVTGDEKPGEKFDASLFTGVVPKPVTLETVHAALAKLLVADSPAP